MTKKSNKIENELDKKSLQEKADIFDKMVKKLYYSDLDRRRGHGPTAGKPRVKKKKDIDKFLTGITAEEKAKALETYNSKKYTKEGIKPPNKDS